MSMRQLSVYGAREAVFWVKTMNHARDRVWRHNPRPLPLARRRRRRTGGSSYASGLVPDACLSAQRRGRGGPRSSPRPRAGRGLLAAAADDDLPEEAVCLLADPPPEQERLRRG